MAVALLTTFYGAVLANMVFNPLEPDVAPALAEQGRIGRARLVGEHGGGPGEVGRELRAALEVNVVGEAVDRRGQRDRRLQRRRRERRDLQDVEADRKSTRLNSSH